MDNITFLVVLATYLKRLNRLTKQPIHFDCTNIKHSICLNQLNVLFSMVYAAVCYLQTLWKTRFSIKFIHRNAKSQAVIHFRMTAAAGSGPHGFENGNGLKYLWEFHLSTETDLLLLLPTILLKLLKEKQKGKPPEISSYGKFCNMKFGEALERLEGLE